MVDLSKKGKFFRNDAEDYFIYSRGSRDWNMMPNFVVGRRAYDNWLVDNSYHDSQMDLIDASNTITALHLTCADGPFAGHMKGADNNHNVQAKNPVTKRTVGPHEWNHGHTDQAHFFTKHYQGKVQILIRSNHSGTRKLPSLQRSGVV